MTFRGNIDHWIRQSEPDYFMIFIRAWIPFNAWYVAEMPQHNRNDSKLIKELQDSTSSKPRMIFESLLRSDSYEAKEFRHRLAQLHIFLETRPFHHCGVRQTFKRIYLSENPKKFANATDKEGNAFKAENKQSYFEMVAVDKNNKTFVDFRKSPYDIEDLKRDVDFIKITDRKIQEKILNCFEAIDPHKAIDLVASSKTKGDYIVLDPTDSVRFINDPTTVAKACIKMLYTLRCMLFHGEVEPTPPYMGAYEHAYFMLRYIVKGLQ